MKSFSIICIIVILFSILFPVLYTAANLPKQNAPETPAVQTADKEVNVKVLSGDDVVNMTLSDYLKGVVAAEMPTSFQPEALKAQAVAARTYTIYKMTVDPSSRHPQADVCTDSSCCKAYITQEKMKENWGDSFDSNFEKISSAVDLTDSQCLVYDGEPILAVFHSSSPGKTENSGQVWTTQLPYLVSVESPETADAVPNYVSSVNLSLDDFRQTVLASYPDASFPDDTSQWVSGTEKDDAGRISSISIGGVKLAGTDVRKLFSLRSSSFEISVGDSVTITTTGYGHGVGMSQYGANIFAAQGKTYDEILKWYYTGAEIGNISSFL